MEAKNDIVAGKSVPIDNLDLTPIVVWSKVERFNKIRCGIASLKFDQNS